jgi:hypothetical protein
MGPSRSTLAVCLALGLAALTDCGSRTGLLIPDGIAEIDAGLVPPPIDAGLMPPPPDATRPSACPDAGATLIYLITRGNDLVAYDPASNTFQLLGPIACSNDPKVTPFSMAVDHDGNPTTIFSDGSLYRLGIHTGRVTCQPIGVVPKQPDGTITQFGMGFTTNDQGGETLYVGTDLVPAGLAILDLTSATIRDVATLQPALFFPELTGNGAGGLYVYAGDTCAHVADTTCTSQSLACYTCSTSLVAQIDKATGRVTGMVHLPDLTLGGGWAVGYWGGALYLFSAPNGASSIVTRFDLTTQQHTQVATYPEIIVGAGVSTCAPLDTP